MKENTGFFTKNGLTLISSFALMIAVLLLVVGWNKIQPSSGDRHDPIMFQECRPIHEGIIFQKKSIHVQKKVAFCNPIVENEKIPQHIVIDLGNGQFVLPTEETATTAVFPVTFDYVASKDWHVIAKE
jgi:hypothetical protein